MKIIVRNEEGIHKVYVQLRDIEYIGERHHSHYFSNYAVRQHNKGIKSDDFICVGNTGVAKLIVEYPYIVDFSITLDSVYQSKKEEDLEEEKELFNYFDYDLNKFID